MWVLRIEPESSTRATSALTTEPPLQPHQTVFFFKLGSFMRHHLVLKDQMNVFKKCLSSNFGI